MGVGYNASAGLVWKRKIKDGTGIMGEKQVSMTLVGFAQKSLFVTSVGYRSIHYINCHASDIFIYLYFYYFYPDMLS